MINLALGDEGILTRAVREMREAGIVPPAPSPLDRMTEPEKRLYRMQVYREVLNRT